MNEEEWLETTDPYPMLAFLQGKVSDRKLRLFAVSCCPDISHLFTADHNHRAVEIAERLADGLPSVVERPEHVSAASYALAGSAYTAAVRASEHAASEFAAITSAANILLAAQYLFDLVRGEQSRVIRDIFGNPFQPVTLDAVWRTPVFTSIARAVYEERELPGGLFDNHRMGVLADALEDAGCAHRDLLDHLRCGVYHTRGCWAIDLLLDKV
jgi:hypothetical protein